MTTDSWTRLFLFHLFRYPKSSLQDFCKLLFQSIFGPGHLIDYPDQSLARIKEESSSASPSLYPYDPIGNGLARVHLGGWVQHPGSLETLNRVFVSTASVHRGNQSQLEEGMKAFQALCGMDILPFSPKETADFCFQWKQKGYPPLHHSSSYRTAYSPAYRVVWIQYPRYQALFSAIDQMLLEKGRCTVAIDGDSGAGKSTLAHCLQQVYNSTLLHMDDFFLPAARKTKERLETPGGNVDWERFLKEIGPAISHRAPIPYRRFDCKRQQLQKTELQHSTPLIVVEGSYSQHPRLRHLYDITVFLTISKETQKRRIEKRSGPLLPRFINEWIPLEKSYHSAFHLPATSTFCFSAEDELESFV